MFSFFTPVPFEDRDAALEGARQAQVESRDRPDLAQVESFDIRPCACGNHLTLRLNVSEMYFEGDVVKSGFGVVVDEFRAMMLSIALDRGQMTTHEVRFLTELSATFPDIVIPDRAPEFLHNPSGQALVAWFGDDVFASQPAASAGASTDDSPDFESVSDFEPDDVADSLLGKALRRKDRKDKLARARAMRKYRHLLDDSDVDTQ